MIHKKKYPRTRKSSLGSNMSNKSFNTQKQSQKRNNKLDNLLFKIKNMPYKQNTSSNELIPVM